MKRKYGAELKKLGNQVTKYRKLSGLTKSELGRQANMDARAIRKIENGEVPIGFDRILSISSALGINPSQLFETIKLKK